jgi:hypothetical protein
MVEKLDLLLVDKMDEKGYLRVVATVLKMVHPSGPSMAVSLVDAMVAL